MIHKRIGTILAIVSAAIVLYLAHKNDLIDENGWPSFKWWWMVPLAGLIVGTKVEKLMEPKQESDENTEEGDKYEGMGIAGVEKLMEPKQESDENTEEGDKYEGMGIAGYYKFYGTVLTCIGIWMTVPVVGFYFEDPDYIVAKYFRYACGFCYFLGTISLLMARVAKKNQ